MKKLQTLTNRNDTVYENDRCGSKISNIPK